MSIRLLYHIIVNMEKHTVKILFGTLASKII